MRPSRILFCSVLVIFCCWSTVECKPFGDLLKKSYLNFDFGFSKGKNSAIVDKSTVFDILWKKFKVVQTVLSVVGVLSSLSSLAKTFSGSQTTESTETEVSYSVDDYSPSSTLFPDVFTLSKENNSKPITISLPTYSADLDPTEGLLPVNKPNSSSGYPSNSLSSTFSISPSVSGEITDQSFLDQVQLQPNKNDYNSDFQGYSYSPGQRGSRGY